MMREQVLPLVLTLVAAYAPAAIGASGQAKVDRLVIGLIHPYRDYMRPWLPVGADRGMWV